MPGWKTLRKFSKQDVIYAVKNSDKTMDTHSNITRLDSGPKFLFPKTADQEPVDYGGARECIAKFPPIAITMLAFVFLNETVYANQNLFNCFVASIL